MAHGPTNALALASSSYLRSAMHQPIQWHEWGDEAFATAQRENKAILLDIGAVWCHWCHVMDRESYENAEIAAIINESFIAIKVDRDERPDVDSRYQAAVQAMSGQGGWPLTAFLTPDGRPFFGGTYFPPDDRWGRPGMKRVLMGIANAFREKNEEVTESADAVMNAIAHQESFRGHAGEITAKAVDRILESALRQFDREWGGFGGQPKFPHAPTVDLVIDYYVRTRNQTLYDLVHTTLTRMALGGVYDQLAGGFHRYSVDAKWIVPHFEKMSYDNSELLKNYVHAYQATSEPIFAGVAKDIIRWVDTCLSDREHGGFYASQDADFSLDDDGDYFTWTRAEAQAVLNEDEFRVAAEHYDIGEIGEMHHDPHKNVLHVAWGVDEIAKKQGLSAHEVERLLASMKEKMLAARQKRPTPYIDKTIYVNWNALLVSAYLEAASALHLEDARHFALRSLDRILAEAWDHTSHRLDHVIRYSDPAAARRTLTGMLDDYAYTAIACLDAYEATSAVSYFNFARNIVDAMRKRFFDEEAGGFFDRDAMVDPDSLVGALQTKRKPLQDTPTPAGNPCATIALLRLFHYTHEAKYREAAADTLECFANVADHFGIYAGTYGIALRLFFTPHTQVIVHGSDAKADALFAAAVEPFAITKSVLRVRDGQAVPENLPPALAATIPQVKAIQDGESVAVICAAFTCQPPISDPEKLREALRQSVQVSG
ncbi:MAG: thioredoxin domain-containing protein [Acidobacteriales bacterium]|nr:thioredoxin domain-containing protein [Terriglobales bacterium]